MDFESKSFQIRRTIIPNPFPNRPKIVPKSFQVKFTDPELAAANGQDSSLPTPDKMAEPQNDGLHTCYKSQFAPDSPVGGHGRGLPTCDPGHVFSKATSQAILETSQSAVYIYIYIYIYRRRGTVIWLRSLYMSSLGEVKQTIKVESMKV